MILRGVVGRNCAPFKRVGGRTKEQAKRHCDDEVAVRRQVAMIGAHRPSVDVQACWAPFVATCPFAILSSRLASVFLFLSLSFFLQYNARSVEQSMPYDLSNLFYLARVWEGCLSTHRAGETILRKGPPTGGSVV